MPQGVNIDGKDATVIGWGTTTFGNQLPIHMAPQDITSRRFLFLTDGYNKSALYMLNNCNRRPAKRRCAESGRSRVVQQRVPAHVRVQRTLLADDWQQPRLCSVGRRLGLLPGAVQVITHNEDLSTGRIRAWNTQHVVALEWTINWQRHFCRLTFIATFNFSYNHLL